TLRHHAELLDQTHDAIMVWDKQSRIQFWNRGAEEMYGWKAAGTQGRLIHELLATEGLPADLEAQLAAGGWKGRLIHRTRDKERLHVETRFTPFQQDGRSLVFEIARDVTERVRTEQRRAAQYAVASLLAGSNSLGEAGPPIVESVAASGDWAFGSIWLWREQDKALHCETCWHTEAPRLAAFEKVTFNTPLLNTTGLPGRVFASKKAAWIKDVTRDPNFPRKVAAAESGLCGGFGFPLFAEGDMEGVLELFSPGPVEPDPDLLKLAEALGSQIGLFIRRRKVEEELQRQKEAAEAANAAKDRFLAMLSHELRTPLTPVLIWAGGTVDQPGLSPELQEGLKMVCRNVELEARLIDDLLDLTRLSRGKLQLQLRTVDLHQIVRQSIEIVSDNVREKHLNLAVTLEATSHQAQVDPSRLQQVFWNVLRNACKFTPQNGAVSVRSHNPLPNLVRIEISDSGVGIAPENLVKIFDAFEQGDSRREGLGLGLAISKAIIDVHQGRITAKSSGLGQGATFVIDLPATGATPTLPA
ncbi:MAG: ATP-binding protein, partial [Chthoniobacterales bacterium]